MDFLVYSRVIWFPHAALQQNAFAVRRGVWCLPAVPRHSRAAPAKLELPWLSAVLGKLSSMWIWEPGPARVGSSCLRGHCCTVGCVRQQRFPTGPSASTADPLPPRGISHGMSGHWLHGEEHLVPEGREWSLSAFLGAKRGMHPQLEGLQLIHRRENAQSRGFAATRAFPDDLQRII